MVQVLTKPSFQGTAREQELAGHVARLMLARGMFMSRNAVMRVSIESLPPVLEKEGVATSVEELLAAVTANAAVFQLSESGETHLVSMTKDQRAPQVRQQASRHTFATRFLTPLPKPEQPIGRTPKPAAPAVDLDILIEMEDLPQQVSEPEVAEVLVVSEPEPEPEPQVEAPVPAVARTITTHVVAPTDVTDVDDLNLAIAIRERLGADPRVANFGEQWLMEDRVPRFSRGDLRRLRDYMQEKEQPLTDDDLTQDVLGVRPGSADLELTRFALNYRLSNEHREFEFVGTANQRFWSTSGLPQIGTTRRKLTEIGTDYRFLLEQERTPSHRSKESVDHTLTFYEFIHGLLPYDGEMQGLLPAPLVPGQKSAVLTFECPQSFITYLVELRYPTPNRGDFFLGLDDFYTENLVPGAIISIARTDNDGHYRVEYLPETAHGDQLLELDERRALRYVFRPTTYACGIDESMLLNEARFSGLSGEKPLDEKVKRRPESVVSATFERIGEERGGNYSAEFTKLLAGVNVERPLSEDLLRSILEHDDTGAFSRDPEGDDVYTYVPGNTP